MTGYLESDPSCVGWICQKQRYKSDFKWMQPCHSPVDYGRPLEMDEQLQEIISGRKTSEDFKPKVRSPKPK